MMCCDVEIPKVPHAERYKTHGRSAFGEYDSKVITKMIRLIGIPKFDTNSIKIFSGKLTTRNYFSWKL